MNNLIQYLKRFTYPHRLELALFALRTNFPLISYVLFLPLLLKLRDNLIQDNSFHPPDILANRKSLLSRAFDSPDTDREVSISDHEISKISLLCLVPKSIYGGSAELTNFISLSKASSTSKFDTLVIDLATPTLLIDQIINRKQVSHVFLWPTMEHAGRLIRYLSFLRGFVSLKVSVFIPDPHSYKSFDEVLKFAEISDFMYAGSTWMPAIISPGVSKRIMYRTFASNLEPTETRSFDQRDIYVSFSGLDKDARLPGLIGLSMSCRKYGIRSKINFFSHKGALKASSLHNYYETLSRSLAVINFSLRTRGDGSEIFDVINGRPFEVLAFKCILIEYKPPQIEMLGIEKYFTDGKDFISFANLTELDQIISRLSRRDPTLIEIAECGYATFQKIFGKMNLIDELVYDFYDVESR